MDTCAAGILPCFFGWRNSFCGEIFFFDGEERGHVLSHYGNGDLSRFVCQGFRGVGFRHGTAKDLCVCDIYMDVQRHVTTIVK